ncbi:MAG: hypothetical protein ACI9AT_000029 [Ulvibacter sp.]|jgi:hypothetical protein
MLDVDVDDKMLKKSNQYQIRRNYLDTFGGK